MESEVFYEKSGVGNMASFSCTITEWLSEACLKTVIVPVHAFSLSLLAAMELFAAEQSKRRLGEGTEVAIAVKEQASTVGSGVAETFGSQIIRVKDVFDLLPASERKAYYVCIFLRLEHDFGTSKADDGRDMLVTPDTDVRLKQKEYSDWLVVAKKDDDDDDEDDDDEEEEDEDAEGEEEGGYDEGDAEEDDNEDDNDAADDGDDDEGDDDDGEGDGGDGDEDEDEEDDDEEYDDEEEEEEPPKKKTK